eukprot:TRINITY_DN49965_c0_g1_i1.p1 TRINITY_DN49965_c0_g1~~TRINITY_DN49965_c0_g1_i1.p1  ORF type:complete len:629 (-),score=98.27 TRINITY_DN49965_c0_g1_i1:94-1980(-)
MITNSISNSNTNGNNSNSSYDLSDCQLYEQQPGCDKPGMSGYKAEHREDKEGIKTDPTTATTNLQLGDIQNELRMYIKNVVVRYLIGDGCRRIRLKNKNRQVLTIDLGNGVITSLGGCEVARLPDVAGESPHKILTDTLALAGLKLLRLLQRNGEELQADAMVTLGDLGKVQGQITAEVQDTKLHVLTNRMALVEKTAQRLTAFAELPVKTQNEFLTVLADGGLKDSQKQKKFRQGLYKDGNTFESKDALLMRIKKLLKSEKAVQTVQIADRLWKLNGKTWECIEPPLQSNSLGVRLDTDADDVTPVLVDSKEVEDLTVTSAMSGKSWPLTFTLSEKVEGPAVFKREGALKRQEAMNVLRKFSQGSVGLHTVVSALVVACSATFVAGEWRVQYEFDGQKEKGRQLKQRLKQRFKRRITEWLYEDTQNQPPLADKLRSAIQDLVDQVTSLKSQQAQPSSSRKSHSFLDVTALLPKPLVTCMRKKQLEEVSMSNEWDRMAFSIELDTDELDAVLEYSQDMAQILEFLLYTLNRSPRQPCQFFSVDTGMRTDDGKKVIKSMRIRTHDSRQAFPKRKGGEVSDSESWDGSASSEGDENHDGRKEKQRTEEEEESYQAELRKLILQSGEQLLK